MKIENNVTNYYKAIPKKYLKTSYPNPNYNNNKIDNPISRFLIIGPSGSGKTNNLLEFIKRTSGCYYHIYMCCKNPHQPLYEWLKDELGDGITITDNIDELPDCSDMEPKGKPKLIIFDDMLTESEKILKKIGHYFIRGRHDHCAVVFLSQSFYQTPILIRRNCNYIIIKKLGSAKDSVEILKSYSLQDINKDTLMKMYKYCITSKNGTPDFMMLDLDHPDMMFRKNFLEILNPKDFI